MSREGPLHSERLDHLRLPCHGRVLLQVERRLQGVLLAAHPGVSCLALAAYEEPASWPAAMFSLPQKLQAHGGV